MPEIVDDFAIIGEAARCDETYRSAQLRDRLDGVLNRRDGGSVGSTLAQQGHTVAAAVVLDDQAGADDLAMAPDDVGDLARVDEHALDLGRLVGAAEPALEAAVGAAARAVAV